MSYKNEKRTYKEIVDQVRMILEWHQEMGERNKITLQSILEVYKQCDIRIEGGHELQ